MMKFDYKETIMGYHGTFESAVQDIINSGFKIEKREDHWLGQGIYLYTNFELSKWWIQTKIEKKLLSEEPAVIEVICKSDVKVLNLDDFEGLNFFYSAFQELLEKLKRLDIPLILKSTKKNISLLDLTTKKPKYV